MTDMNGEIKKKTIMRIQVALCSLEMNYLGSRTLTCGLYRRSFFLERLQFDGGESVRR